MEHTTWFEGKCENRGREVREMSRKVMLLLYCPAMVSQERDHWINVDYMRLDSSKRGTAGQGRKSKRS